MKKSRFTEEQMVKILREANDLKLLAELSRRSRLNGRLRCFLLQGVMPESTLRGRSRRVAWAAANAKPTTAQRISTICSRS